MFCPRCGAENEKGSKYCASCGASLPQEDGGARNPSKNRSFSERAGAIVGRDRRTRFLTLGTLVAIFIAVIAFLVQDASEDEGASADQDAYTRTLDAACVHHKVEVAAAQRKALGGGGLAAVSRYADATVPIVGEWRLELGRAPVPADHKGQVAALQAALLEVQIEAGALARVARESNRSEAAKVAARVDAATANVEAAVQSLGLVRCGELVVSQGQLIDQ
jgi:zinc-ribbon domain